MSQAAPLDPGWEDAAEPLLLEDRLYAELESGLHQQGWPPADVERVHKGFEFARRFHEGQKRRNGDNYISHPVSVAQILAGVRAEPDMIIAALLHDVLEDTNATAEDIRKAFGPEVLKLVEGVTKLGKYRFSSKEEAQAENFRKMFLAMSDDARVITLKLADRLHNMRTLYYLKPEKQKKIAAETIDIFAPLANRMGMGNFRAELEDLSLRYLHPEAYELIEQELASTRIERERNMGQVIERITSQLKVLSIDARIYGRLKNYYSIYKKMVSQQKDLQAIFDISALRIVVNTEPECYEVLGVIHNAFTPVAGRFKDYIAMPKSNFYQSLHTTIIGPAGRPMEVQIRTHRMHEIAEYGIAAHFKYKEAGGSVAVVGREEQKLAWLKQMADMKAQSAQEFVDSVKLDLFPDQVFVFTPKGEVISLPKGSTPVDFAFRIHTEVGNRCSGAIVNERIVPLDAELQNGDIVEIITNKKASPRLDWVNFVQTQHAKSRIRQWYKKHYRDQHEQNGRQLLEAELTRADVDQLVKNGRLLDIAKELNYQSLEDLWVALGYGEISLARIINRLKKPDASEAQQAAKTADDLLPAHEITRLNRLRESSASQVVGLKGLLYNVAKCCMPVPGDTILGIVTRSRGVMIHRDDCVNTLNANPDRLMKLTWDGPVEMRGSGVHEVTLDIQVLDRIGIFKDVLTQVSDNQINVTNARCKRNEDARSVQIELTVEVRNLDQLELVLNQIRKLNDVVAVKRGHHRLNKQ